MRLDHYPAQEPLSPVGAAYAAQCLARGEGVLARCHGETFAYGPDPYQTLTVFPAPGTPRGVLVFLHGGGWTSGYKEWMYFMAPALLAQGITLVCPGYRLAPGHVFPTGLDDAADALAWVHDNMHRLGTPPGRLFVGGHSAGGHLAALLAVTQGWRARRHLPLGLVAGCLPVSGVYRFGAGSGLSARPRFLGDAADNELHASPALLIDAAVTPPFFMAHGERDFGHLIAQAIDMEDLLQRHGVPVQRQVLPDCDHFGASLACGEHGERGWPARAAQWMRQTGAK